MSVKGCKLHYKCIEEIAHFYTKLTAPKLTLLLGGTTSMWGKYLGLCCPRGRADFLVVVVDIGAIFLSSENDAKNIFSKNKLSGDIGLMVQMLDLNFVAAAAASNY